MTNYAEDVHCRMGRYAARSGEPTYRSFGRQQRLSRSRPRLGPRSENGAGAGFGDTKCASRSALTRTMLDGECDIYEQRTPPYTQCRGYGSWSGT